MERTVNLNEQEIMLLRELVMEDIKVLKTEFKKAKKTKNFIDAAELETTISNCETLFNKLR